MFCFPHNMVTVVPGMASTLKDRKATTAKDLLGSCFFQGVMSFPEASKHTSPYNFLARAIFHMPTIRPGMKTAWKAKELHLVPKNNHGCVSKKVTITLDGYWGGTPKDSMPSHAL